MNLKKNHYSRRALALLLTLVMCVGMIPTAFAAQQNSYHDPAEHWMQASGRTNELDANSVVTRETFKCGECGKATSFEVFRVPEYTRNGQPALSRNVKYSDGTMVDGVGKGDTMDGIPGKDATYTGYHYTKAVCETCGGINTNMSKSEYGYLKNVYWLYDCAAAFTQELDETVSYEYTDDTYHTVTTKGGNGALRAVPMAGPTQDTAYVPTRPKAWGVAKGAKNPEGAAYFLRYFLDPANSNMNGTFYNSQFGEVFNIISKASTKKSIKVASGVIEYSSSGAYSTLQTDLSNATPSQINTVLNSKNGIINNAVNRANAEISRIR